MSAIGVIAHPIDEALIGFGTNNVTSADIDNDGHSDLIVSANIGTLADQILLFRNQDGSGTRWEVSTVSDEIRSGTNGVGLATGDLDNDGDLDLIATSQLSPAHLFWYENLDGEGSFGPRRELLETSFPDAFEPTVADFDGDGDLDILAGSRWLENVNHAERFDAHALPDNDFRSAAVDIDSDGDWDLVAFSRSEARVYGNAQGWGQFENFVSIPLDDTFTATIKSGDLDGNGHTDLILIGSKVQWIPNLGSLQFGASRFIADSARTNFSFTAIPIDIDQDGDLDLAAASSGDRKVVWYENSGTGEFATEHTIASSLANTANLSVADWDGNGTPDLTFTNLGNFVWYRNSGGGTFEDLVMIATSLSGPVTPTSGDLDGDGDMDVLVEARAAGAIYWYENLGGAWQQRSVGATPGDAVLHVLPADLDGDGDLDVVSGTFAGLHWFENVNAAENSFVHHEIATGQTEAVVAGDLDNDGDVDLVAWSAGSIRWLENLDGRGTFGPSRSILSSPNKSDSYLELSDFDGDGLLDILAYSRFNDLVVWLRNQNGGEQFQTVTLPGRTSIDTSPFVADIEGDGDADILLGGSILLNDAGGNFTEWRAVIGATRILGAGDLDRDGDLDLITRTNSAIRWRENLGDRFEDRGEILPSLGSISSVQLAQLDPHDDVNLLFATAQAELYWIDFALPGDVNSDGVFDSADLVAVLSAGEYEDDVAGNSTFATGDWNGDGEFTTSDLVLAFQAGYNGGPL